MSHRYRVAVRLCPPSFLGSLASSFEAPASQTYWRNHDYMSLILRWSCFTLHCACQGRRLFVVKPMVLAWINSTVLHKFYFPINEYRRAGTTSNSWDLPLSVLSILTVLLRGAQNNLCWVWGKELVLAVRSKVTKRRWCWHGMKSKPSFPGMMGSCRHSLRLIWRRRRGLP